MSVYDFTHIPELAAEEKRSPYAKFYNEPVKAPAAEIVAALKEGKQMDASQVLPPSEVMRLFTPGTLKAENGYCVLPDGTGYSVTHSKLAGVTEEMEEWWGKWIVSPEYNHINFKITLPGLTYMYGNPVWANLGWGNSNIHVVQPQKPLEPSTLPKELNPDFYSMDIRPLIIVPEWGVGRPYWATTASYITIGKKGEEITTCVWSGTHIINGEPLRMLDKTQKVEIENVRLLACHYAWGQARKGQLLAKLCAHSKTLVTA